MSMLSQPLDRLRKNAKAIGLSALPIATALVLVAVPVLAVTTQTGQLNVNTATDPYAIKAYNTNTAANSTGIFGVTYAAGSKAIYGYSAAQTGAPSFGVAGISQNGYGVYGSSYSVGVTGIFGENIGTGGTAIQGNSSSGNGVVGMGGANGLVGTTNSTVNGFSGVLGQDATGVNYGVEGTTTTGYAVVGIANSNGGFGAYFGGLSGDGADGISTSGDGVYGYSTSGNGMYAASSSGTALRAATNSGLGALIRNASGNGTDSEGSYIGVIGRANASGGFPIVATDQTGADLFYVTGVGDVYYHGGLHTFAVRAGGGTATAFGPKTTEPTIEDVGSGSLVNGVATIKLDTTFAQTIDQNAKYHVFLTPNGDTRGLFVATKTASGFTVKECQGGHGSLDFDYRIVASPTGGVHQRMRALASEASAATAPLAARPKVPVEALRRDLRLLTPKTGQIIRISPAQTTPGLRAH